LKFFHRLVVNLSDPEDSAKGQEWRAVYVLSAIDGCF